MQDNNRQQKTLLFILALALVLRLGVAFSLDQTAVYHDVSGDSGWYLSNGYALVSGWYDGKFYFPGAPDVLMPVYLPNVPTAPLYLIFIGMMQHMFSPPAAIMAIRLLQTVMSTATVYFVFGLAQAVSRNRNVGLFAAAVLAISPVFIIEPAQVLTETVYIFFTTAGLWAYLQFVQQATDNQSPRMRSLALSGGLLGLAVLTRAVLIVFPLGLAFHLLLVSGWRKSIRRVLALLGTYAAVALIWTVFNLLVWNQWVIGAQGFAAFLYLGSTNAGWQGPTQVDAALAQQSGGVLPSDPSQQQDIYQTGALENISGNLSGWLLLRAKRLGAAYLQPHGTTFFPGESLKAIAVSWWTHDRTIGGLLRLTTGEAFWPKLVIYLFHFIGLTAGLVGLWLTRRNWRFTLPLAGFILYTSLIHFVLDANPRYLFPMEAVWWVFAAVTLYRLSQRNLLAKLLYHRQIPLDGHIRAGHIG